ncbi:MAG TPA: alpha-N-arabinofuranosidase, partial [Terriglobales bacterium]|nr:alpha-N-arabinofuranosidase [Terriglobales bacterium]
GGANVSTSTEVGATAIPLSSAIGFRVGQSITVDSGDNSETAVVANIRRFGATSITVTAPLTHAHAVGAQVSGTGITLSTPLTRPHAIGAQVYDNAPTPGAPNHYLRRSH